MSERIHGAKGLGKVIGRSHDYVTRKVRELGGGNLRVLWWRDEEAALKWWERLISTEPSMEEPPPEAPPPAPPAPPRTRRKPQVEDGPLDLKALRDEYQAPSPPRR